jgi:hypothetical protein
MRSVISSLVVIGLVSMVLPATQAQASIMLDMTTSGAMHTDGTAVFRQFSLDGSTGSGNIDSFVRIQGDGAERGYNTDGKPQFDTKPGAAFTHSLLLSSIPETTVDGVLCREFLLDINQNNNNLLSLDAIKIYIADVGNLADYPTDFGAPVYDLGDNWLKLDYRLASGSGSGDMLMYVTSSLFGTDGAKYVYLYSAFGAQFAGNDGYEEWARGTEGPVAPEPATLALLALGGVAMLLRRRRQT